MSLGRKTTTLHNDMSSEDVFGDKANEKAACCVHFCTEALRLLRHAFVFAMHALVVSQTIAKLALP
jgi:hypothetical protein